MNKRHFGELLRIKFENHLPLTGAEIVTGLFQQSASLASILDPGSVQDFFSVGRLAYFRDWAELRLNDWVAGRGAELAETVATVWRGGNARPVRHPFHGAGKGPPETPRNMAEWGELLDTAARWLQARWKREIGTSAWVSENQLYQLLKRQLKGLMVQQHAQPAWVAPQHLDVFIPEVSIAVEYMGRQHFEPVDFFGGEPGFRALQDRDMRKREACAAHNVDLCLVRHDEAVGTRAKEIVERAKAKRSKT